MLVIDLFATQLKPIGHPDAYMRFNGDPVWFDDPFVKEIVFAIDKSTVYSARSIESLFLGIIGYNELSAEWVLLHSPIFSELPVKPSFTSIGRLFQHLYNVPVADILRNGRDYIESKIFLTEENFYYTLIRFESQIRGFKYSKTDTDSPLFSDENIRHFSALFDYIRLRNKIKE